MGWGGQTKKECCKVSVGVLFVGDRGLVVMHASLCVLSAHLRSVAFPYA